MSGIEYLPHKGDIVTVDFDPSTGKEIKKRRPALVVSNAKYSQLTGLAVVCPITHAEHSRLKNTGILVELHQQNVDGYVNPLQFHTFDFRRRNFEFVEQIEEEALNKALQTINDVINASEPEKH